jgi:hypothetical protein
MLVWKKKGEHNHWVLHWKASAIIEFNIRRLAQSLSRTLTSLCCGTWRFVCVVCRQVLCRPWAQHQLCMTMMRLPKDTQTLTSGSMTVMMLTDCRPVTGRRSVRPCDHSIGSSLCNMDTAWTDFCSNGVHGPAKEWISSNFRSVGGITLPQGVE